MNCVLPLNDAHEHVSRKSSLKEKKKPMGWVGEQGWRSGDSARLPPMWSGFDSGQVPYVGLVCCWFSPLSGTFSPSSLAFLLLQNLHLQIQVRPGSRASSLNFVVYLFIYYLLLIYRRFYMLYSQIIIERFRSNYVRKERVEITESVRGPELEDKSRI